MMTENTVAAIHCSASDRSAHLRRRGGNGNLRIGAAGKGCAVRTWKFDFSGGEKKIWEGDHLSTKAKRGA